MAGTPNRRRAWRWVQGASVAALCMCAQWCGALDTNTNMFSPVSTPADAIRDLAYFVVGITGAIFVTVSSLLVYACVRYRQRSKQDNAEPAQVYGSTQVELAWTIVPVLIVVVLFLTTARLIFAIQDAPRPQAAVEVTVVGHQFWWEFRYPKLGVVTANELHVPVSDASNPTPTYLTLLSADVDHSFWIPRLAGKTDVIPNHINTMWIDPRKPGLYEGQCAQFCGTQHAKMLLRVYVQTKADFDRWVSEQQKPAPEDASVQEGRRIFQTQACINCHTVRGTPGTGRFGPDLTHLMSRETLAAGATQNTEPNLRAWIKDPDQFKPGSLMPAMKLTDQQIEQVSAYLATLH